MFTTIALIGGFLTSLAFAMLVTWAVASEIYSRWVWSQRKKRIRAVTREVMSRHDATLRRVS